MDSSLLLLVIAFAEIAFGVAVLMGANNSSAWERASNSSACKVTDPDKCDYQSVYTTKVNLLISSSVALIVSGVCLLLFWLFFGKK